MSQGRGVRDALKSIVPAWLSDRAAGFNKGFKVLWTIALMADGIVEASLEGVRAALPGVGTATALHYIGASRRIIRGIGESDATYAARLRGWLDLWTNAASDETTLRLLQAFLGPEPDGSTPTCRLINRAGLFSYLDSSGEFFQDAPGTWTIPNLSWDLEYNPERSQWWSDIWIVLYVTNARWPFYFGLDDPAFAAAWGAGTLGTGHQVTREAYQGVMNIIADMKGAHTYVQAVIVSTDIELYAPDTLGIQGDPNGRWGAFSAPDSRRIQIPERALTSNFGAGNIRYWAPPGGG
jgi:hypothetical protein